jgi:hypothetical protein
MLGDWGRLSDCEEVFHPSRLKEPIPFEPLVLAKRIKEGGGYEKPQRWEPWTEMDVRALMAALRIGDTIEEAAIHLCRSGSVDDVRRKAEELGLKYDSRVRRQADGCDTMPA